MQDALPAELLAWLAPHVGEARLRPVPGADGRVQTWEVLAAGRSGGAGSGQLFVRWGRPARKHAQEVAAARQLWPRLPGTPALVFADAQGLLMTACPGTHSDAPDAARAAGARVRSLHALPLDDTDPLPLPAAVSRRIAGLARRLQRHGLDLPSPLDAPLPALRPRRWCHRDLAPRNWLWDGAAAWLVDWEHARPDSPDLDLGKVAAHPCWPDFQEGYGPVSPPALRLALALHGAGTLAWGLDHDDDAFTSEGRRILAGIAAGTLPGDG